VRNSIQIEWYETTWIGSKANKNRRQLRTYISRPKNAFGYNLAKLVGLSRDWEAAKVEETEKLMTRYRREAHAITRAMYALRSLLEKK
jgi:hypothetical protein